MTIQMGFEAAPLTLAEERFETTAIEAIEYRKK